MWCNPPPLVLAVESAQSSSPVVTAEEEATREKKKKSRLETFFCCCFTACCKDKDFTTQSKQKSRHLFKSRLGQSFSWSQFDIRASVMSWNRKEDSHPPLHESLSQTGDNDWIGPHGLHMSRRESDPAGASTKGKRKAALTPRSPTAASWRTCGSLGRWTPPRAAGRGAASRWPQGRSPGVAARRPDPDAGLRSPAPRSLESTGAPCRSAAGTAWWGLGRGNAPGKPDRKDVGG